MHRARQTKARRAQKAVRETEVEPKPRRRRFTAKEKARILRLTDAAPPGQIAVILRREGLYASTLQKWRAQREERALEPKKRGRKADPQAARIKQLEAKVGKLERTIKQQAMLLDLQKKLRRSWTRPRIRSSHRSDRSCRRRVRGCICSLQQRLWLTPRLAPCPAASLARTPIVKANPLTRAAPPTYDDGTPVLRHSGMCGSGARREQDDWVCRTIDAE